MLSNRPDGLKMTGPLYLVALLLVFVPAMDFVGTVIPLQGGSIEWRFSSVGLLSGYLLTPLLGIVLAMTIAEASDHQVLQRLIAGINVLTVLFFVAMLVVFALDIVQMRSAVPLDRRGAFASAAVRAVLKHALFIVALGWLARRGWVASRQTAFDSLRRVAPSASTGEAKVAI